MNTIVDDFHAWLRNAKAGDRFAYHRGYLVIDRNDPSQPDRADINFVADQYLDLAKAGTVRLVQKRVDDPRWDYIAERTSR